MIFTPNPHDYPIAPAASASKAEWRSWARRMREALHQSGQLDTLYPALIQQLLTWSVFQKARTVLSYAAIGHELDLTPLLTNTPDKHWYFPLTTADSMRFHRMHSSDTFELREASGVAIPEPPDTADPLTTVPDLILLPALCVDAQGIRLGYGKGYYDRWLSEQPQLGHTAVLVPEALYVAELPHESWDMAVQTCITDTGVKFSR